MKELALFNNPTSDLIRISENARTIARDPKTSGLTLSQLTCSSNIWVRSACAVNRNLTSEEMLALAKDPSFFVRYSLVHNENLCNKAVSVLDKDDDARVRLAMAKLFKFSSNHHLIKREREISERLEVENDTSMGPSREKSVMLARLATTKEEIELIVGSQLGSLPRSNGFRICLNTHTPQSVLSSFIEVEKCMKYVIQHVNCTEDTLRHIFAHYQEDVEGFITYEDRLKLRQDGDNDAFISDYVSRKEDHLIEIGTSMSVSLNTPPDILTTLATSRFNIHRCSVAKNPNTPLPTLADLSKDMNEDVRTSLAQHSKLTDQIALRLSQDEAFYVRIFLAQNKHTKSHILIILANDDQERVVAAAARNKGLPEQEIRKLHKHINDKVRANVAANLSAPADILSVLSSDSSDMVRERLAENINLDHDSYDLLSHDTSIRVLRAVKNNCEDLTIVERVSDKINALNKSPQWEETNTSGSKLIFAFIVFFIGVMLMLNGTK